ncbi:response regulator [Algoriphagus yeomjeoni]|uniref:Response regulator receiver domain-containing protein n=1 Tax=Algoriphagus yeomjeoni TaxID=291403 RepID=A0A327PLV9_9BACT|nr:response regulator [Algoriphagus yeomjeoni]RAI92152.1 response regulator receiver domain-containing protein [Algoriphagus yeomjeoni]
MQSTAIYKILLLDDDRIQKILLEKRLIKINPGIEIVYFDMPDKALEYLKSESVDLILSDLNLPEMSGWEFVEEASKFSPDSRVILQSGSVDSEQYQRATSDIRISEIFEKPLSESDLRAILGL